jgi:hypothetical protein
MRISAKSPHFSAPVAVDWNPYREVRSNEQGCFSLPETFHYRRSRRRHLISLYLVDNVISDRQSYRDEAVSSISQSYATEQRIVGPLLVQPYRQTTPV